MKNLEKRGKETAPKNSTVDTLKKSLMFLKIGEANEDKESSVEGSDNEWDDDNYKDQPHKSSEQGCHRAPVNSSQNFNSINTPTTSTKINVIDHSRHKPPVAPKPRTQMEATSKGTSVKKLISKFNRD